jgi:hypothetical protein
MCCVLEIAMLIWGIVALATGKFMVTRNKVVYGPMARVIGAILMLPLPVSFFIGILIGVGFAAQGKKFDMAKAQVFSPIELGIVVLCFAAAMAIALATGKPVRKKRIPQDEEYFDNLDRGLGSHNRLDQDYPDEGADDQRIQR